jgi:hypothetical protein
MDFKKWLNQLESIALTSPKDKADRLSLRNAQRGKEWAPVPRIYTMKK